MLSGAKLSRRLAVAVVMAVSTVAASDAAAEPRFDPMIAQAVADKVAARMGEMRGTIAIGETPVFLPDFMTTQSVSATWSPARLGLGVPLGVHNFAPRPVPAERRSVRIVYAGYAHAVF